MIQILKATGRTGQDSCSHSCVNAHSLIHTHTVSTKCFLISETCKMSSSGRHRRPQQQVNIDYSSMVEDSNPLTIGTNVSVLVMKSMAGGGQPLPRLAMRGGALRSLGRWLCFQTWRRCNRETTRRRAKGSKAERTIRRRRSCPSGRRRGHRPWSEGPKGGKRGLFTSRWRTARLQLHARTRKDPNMAMEERKCQMSWSSKNDSRIQSRLCSRDSAGVFCQEEQQDDQHEDVGTTFCGSA